MTRPAFTPPSASRQVAFHQLLVGARKTWLDDALREALKEVDPNTLRAEIADLVPPDVQRTLQAAGIRDEYVFPTPVVLAAKPTLVGYYRLLLGASQKMFYRAETGLGMFKSMEVRGTLSPRQRDQLPHFCRQMAEVLAELVREISPVITQRDVQELPLLTLGGQFQGANNVSIGKQATVAVFLAIEDIVKSHVVEQTERTITVQNASGRHVTITLSGDPDVRIEENFGGSLAKNVAIEIKGGTDRSNAYNRAGEAEKSHQKAKGEGFRDCWTIITLKGLELNSLRTASPTTTVWFDAAQVLGREGPDWDRFRNEIGRAVGIPV